MVFYYVEKKAFESLKSESNYLVEGNKVKNASNVIDSHCHLLETMRNLMG